MRKKPPVPPDPKPNPEDRDNAPDQETPREPIDEETGDGVDDETGQPAAEPSSADVRREEEPDRSFPVVGIGASAGGLAALENFLTNLPPTTDMAFVIVQHLSPDYDSALSHILQNFTEIPVHQVVDQTHVQPNHIYVIPPDRDLAIRGRVLELEPRDRNHAERTTVDRFLESLAADCTDQAISIILSGTGSDGSLGLKAIKEKGGVTMAQSPDDADYDGMPRSAVNTRMVDIVRPASVLAERLVEMHHVAKGLPFDTKPEDLDESETSNIERILELIESQTGNDFSPYKRSTIIRRIARRLQVQRIHTTREYLDFLARDPDELEALTFELLISVTSFFRDEDVWEAVREQIIRPILENHPREEPIRVWVAGCATGEEAYTVAILFHECAEALGRSLPELKIFATDINLDSIEVGRAGLYSRQIEAMVSKERLRRFFAVESNGYRVKKFLRDQILFAVHNLLSDPPLSNIDFVSCRNLLIYLKSDAKKRVLDAFGYALHPEGYLLLGTSETTSLRPALFGTIDSSNHIFEIEKRPRIATHSLTNSVSNSYVRDVRRPRKQESVYDPTPLHQRSLLDQFAPPSLLVDEDYNLVHVHKDVTGYLKIGEGEPTHSILKLVDSSLRSAVRSCLFRVFEKEESGFSIRLEVGDTDARVVRLDVSRLHDSEHDVDYAQLVIHEPDVSTPESDPPLRLEDSPLIEQLEEELERMRDRLQTTVEEYEAANEELKASNEELLSMNEELQSTTEELETSREDLQSTNEELKTVNDELNSTIRELNSVNSDLENLLASTDIGTIFLNRDFEVKRYTDPVLEYVNLIPSDRGRPFQHVTHRFKDASLLQDAKDVLDSLESIERETESQDGRVFLVRTLPYRTVDDRIDGVAMTFVDITLRKRAEERLADSERKFRTFFSSASDAMFVYHLDEELRPTQVEEVNASAVELTGSRKEDLKRRTINSLIDGEFDHQERFARLVEEGKSLDRGTVRCADGETIPVELHARRIQLDGEIAVVEVIRDITERHRHEEALEMARDQAEELADLRSMFLSTMSHEIRSPLTAILTYAEVLSRSLTGDQKESVEKIRRSGDRLKESLESILRLARLESGEQDPLPETFSIYDRISTTVDMFRDLAELKGLELVFEQADEDLEGHLDPRFFDQIVSNLVDNAIKYSDTGAVTVRCGADDEYLTIEVEDEGIGISPEETKSIFRRFRRSKRAEARTDGGTGLGLPIARLLVESMDGEISVDSKKNEGSTFKVRLPRRI